MSSSSAEGAVVGEEQVEEKTKGEEKGEEKNKGEGEFRHFKSVMVVPGAHCRLSNISRQGRFIEFEIFMVRGKQ